MPLNGQAHPVQVVPNNLNMDDLNSWLIGRPVEITCRSLMWLSAHI